MSSRLRLEATLLAACLCATVGGAARGDVLTLSLDPAKTRLTMHLSATLHGVKGTLGPGSGTIEFDPVTGTAGGEVVVDLTRAETGVARRDEKMHEKILKTDRHPSAVFRPDRVDVPEPIQQGANDLQVHGNLEFHGSTHRVSLVTRAVLDGDRVTATARLEIPYVEWGVDDPSFFVLRVAKVVTVEIHATGRLAGALP